ncbi:MAG: hypothetical protein ACRDE2_14160 [Chitinophagaceae bacterium]
MNNTQQKLLEQKIEDISFGNELKGILLSNNISALKDLLEIDVWNWHTEIPNFNYHHQNEIINYLVQNDLTDFLKEE